MKRSNTRPISLSPSLDGEGDRRFHLTRVAIADRRKNEPAGAALRSAADESQQVGIDYFGMRRAHAVREAFVGLQRAVLEQLD